MRSRRPTRVQLWASLRTSTGIERFGVVLLVTMAICVTVGWAFVVTDAWDAVRAHVAPTHGTLSIQHCEKPTDHRRPVFRCTGSFASRDFRLNSVHVVLHDEPGATVTGVVSGAGATTIWPDGDWWSWVGGIVMAVVLPFGVWYLLRLLVDMVEPLGGWPKPPRPPVPADHVPQLGDRARKRRRRTRR